MGSRNDDDEGFVRVRCPVPGSSTRSHGRGLPLLVGSVDGGFAAVMAQVRRPVPFRTRKLRPGAAMVLHSEGCGRVARRRIQTCLAGSPDGDPAFFCFRGVLFRGSFARGLSGLRPSVPWPGVAFPRVIGKTCPFPVVGAGRVRRVGPLRRAQGGSCAVHGTER